MKKILIINRLGIGDVVLTTPLAQAIKEQISAKVGFVVSPKAVDILKDHPYIDDVFGYRLPSKQAMLEQIRSLHYDTALVVDERLSSTLLALRAGCRPLNMGFEISFGKRRIFVRKQHAQKAVQDYTSYIRYITQKKNYQYIAPVIGHVDQASNTKINTWLNENNFLTGKLVLIVARGLSDNKNWLPEYFAQLNDYLNQQGIIPVYLGSKQDGAYIDSISGTKVNAAGYFSLREVAVVAQYADLCISLCTGAMHIIATANTPILALYGPTLPERWAPKEACVLQADLPCTPCERLDCTNSVYKQCMKSISPQQVVDMIEEKGWLKSIRIR